MQIPGTALHWLGISNKSVKVNFKCLVTAPEPFDEAGGDSSMREETQRDK